MTGQVTYRRIRSMNKENKGPPEKKGYAVYVIFRKIIVYLF